MMNKSFFSIALWVSALALGIVTGRMIFADGQTGASDSVRERAGLKGSMAGEPGNRPHQPRPNNGGRAFDGIGSSNFEYLLDSIYSDHESLEASKQWSEFLKGLDSREIGEVLDRISQKGYSTEMNPYFSAVWKRWAELDPRAALDRARDPGGLSFQSDPGYSNWVTMVVLMDWSSHDPMAAVDWMESNPEASEPSRRALNTIMHRLAYADGGGEQAASLLKEISNTNNRNSAIRSFVRDYGNESGFQEVLSWGVSLQDVGLKSEALLAIAGHAEDYEQAEQVAEWLLENGHKEKLSLMSGVMEEMSRKDFSLALDYLNKVEDEAMKRSAFAGLVADGVPNGDPSVILDLMDSNPSLYVDETAEKFVASVFVHNRPTAMRSISRIKDDQRRNDAYRKHMLAWLAHDYEAAMEWASGNGMPEAVEVMMRDLLITQDP